MAGNLVSGSGACNGAEALNLTCLTGVGRVPRMVRDPKEIMALALAEAEAGARNGEVPVGAILLDGPSGEILARAHNRVEEFKDPTAHAELLVIQEASRRLGLKRLTEAELYVTLEPCPMCAQAIAFARLRRLVFGAEDPKGGGVVNGPRIFEQPSCHHRAIEIEGGVEAGALRPTAEGLFQGTALSETRSRSPSDENGRPVFRVQWVRLPEHRPNLAAVGSAQPHSSGR